MKKVMFILLLLLISSNGFSQKNSADTEAEIKQEIVKESEYFYNRDFPNWADRYLHDAKVYWSCIEEGIILEAKGWDKLSVFVGDYMKANPTPLKVQIKRDNYKFQAYGDAVWVTFDEYQTTPEKNLALRGVRIFEKTKNGWKVVYMNSYPQPKA
jgi:ketosteroid isomerase-like protein